jgi:hypothetical protein
MLHSGVHQIERLEQIEFCPIYFFPSLDLAYDTSDPVVAQFVNKPAHV